MKSTLRLKRLFVVFLTLAVSFVFSVFYPAIDRFLIPLSALAVLPTPVGLTLREGLVRFIIIFASALLASIVTVFFKTHLQIDFLSEMLASMLFIFLIFKITRDGFESRFLLAGLFFCIILFLKPVPMHELWRRLGEITLGAATGIIINLLIFPRQIDTEFRDCMMIILNAYQEYFSCILDLLFKKKAALESATRAKLKVENSIASRLFPSWVYKEGFSIMHQSGHRHFLIMVERLGQNLFSLHQIARHPFDSVLLEDLRVPIEDFKKQVDIILSALITVLQLNKLPESVNDLSEEEAQLQNAFDTVAPPTLELITLTPDYILLAAFIADCKDIRAILLRLGQAVQNAAGLTNKV